MSMSKYTKMGRAASMRQVSVPMPLRLTSFGENVQVRR